MYNVQCLAGHVYEAPAGSDLEQRCIKWEQEGYLDALCLSPEECDGCRIAHENRLRREASLCGELGCPMNEECEDGCLVLQELRELESVPA